MPDRHNERGADVLIVGAGIAGLSLAIALSKNDCKVVVIDGADRPKPGNEGVALKDWDLRVSALTPTSIRFLESLGVWQRVPSERTAPYQAMCVWDADGTGRITFNAEDVAASSLGHIVENRLTVQALIECAEASSSVELRWQSALESLSRTPDGWSIDCSGDQRFAAQLVVAADGARSKVRQLTAQPTRDWDYHQSAIVGTVALSSPHQATCWQAFLRSGPLALLPLPDPSKVALVWSLDEQEHAEVAALSDIAFVQALNQALGPLAPHAEAVGPRLSFPLKQSHAVDYVDEALVLVGDAAHSIHPLAGQGINLGLSDVRVLAQELLAASAGGLAVSSPIALKRYQRQRKSENLAMMAAMEGFKRGFGSPHPAAVILRNIGLNMVERQHWLKRWFMRQALN
jgi:2-octaprenylphenol hydroxylase